jgi:hypothetical protein
MPSPKKAVAVAKDVLAQLKLKKIKFKIDSGYLRGEIPLAELDKEKGLQEQIDVVQKNCEVCALGGCFLSYVRLYNHVEFDTVVGEKDEFNMETREYAPVGYRADLDDDVLLEKLADLFTPVQMGLIELAFECPSERDRDSWLNYQFTSKLKDSVGLGDYDNVPPAKERTAKKWDVIHNTLAFGRRFKKADDRITAIMKNIVRNKGKFVPPKKK